MTTLVNELVQELIASKLSDYFANFEASQVQLKGGQVLLHDVELRRDALDALNLPLRLKSGRIGTFNLRLNLQSLISDWLSVSSMIALDSTHSCAASLLTLAFTLSRAVGACPARARECGPHLCAVRRLQ